MARRKLQPGELSRDAAVHAARRTMRGGGRSPSPVSGKSSAGTNAAPVRLVRTMVAAFVRGIASDVPFAGCRTLRSSHHPGLRPWRRRFLSGVDLADVGTPPVVVLQALGNSPQAFAAFQQGCRIWDERRRAEWQHLVERAEYVHHDAVVECLRTPDQTLAQLEVEATRWNHSPEQVIRSGQGARRRSVE